MEGARPTLAEYLAQRSAGETVESECAGADETLAARRAIAEARRRRVSARIQAMRERRRQVAEWRLVVEGEEAERKARVEAATRRVREERGRREGAAVSIQSGYRRLRAALRVRPVLRRLADGRAAIKIQTLHRASVAAVSVRRLRVLRRVATNLTGLFAVGVVQAACRGRLARRRLSAARSLLAALLDPVVDHLAADCARRCLVALIKRDAIEKLRAPCRRADERPAEEEEESSAPRETGPYRPRRAADRRLLVPARREAILRRESLELSACLDSSRRPASSHGGPPHRRREPRLTPRRDATPPLRPEVAASFRKLRTPPTPRPAAAPPGDLAHSCCPDSAVPDLPPRAAVVAFGPDRRRLLTVTSIPNDTHRPSLSRGASRGGPRDHRRGGAAPRQPLPRLLLLSPRC